MVQKLVCVEAGETAKITGGIMKIKTSQQVNKQQMALFTCNVAIYNADGKRKSNDIAHPEALEYNALVQHEEKQAAYKKYAIDRIKKQGA